MHPPITQYHNPFPVFPQANGPKHVLVPANSLPHHAHHPHAGKPAHEKYPTTQNLISSSSNIAQTVLPQYPMKTYIAGKPAYIGNKPEYSNLKYFNNIQTTSKVPASNFVNQPAPSFVNQQGNPPSFQIYSTTSRVPLLRYTFKIDIIV